MRSLPFLLNILRGLKIQGKVTVHKMHFGSLFKTWARTLSVPVSIERVPFKLRAESGALDITCSLLS